MRLPVPEVLTLLRGHSPFALADVRISRSRLTERNLRVLREVVYRRRERLVTMGETRETAMSITIPGTVTNGLVVPSSPLPGRARVEIHLQPNRPEVPPELQEEFDGWERAGAGTVEMVELLAAEMEAKEKR